MKNIKNTLKKIASAAVCAFAALTCGAAAGAEDSDFVISGGVLLDYTGNDASDVIPYSVTSIERVCMEDNYTLTSLTIPGSVQSISYGDALSEIDPQPFSRCCVLSEIVLKDSGYFTMYEGGLYTADMSRLIAYPRAAKGSDGVYTVPEGVVSIGSGAFFGCSNLSAINLPSSIKTVSDNAFYGCTKLERINVASGNTFYCDVDGVLFNSSKSKLLFYPDHNSGSYYRVPEGVKNLSDFAFGGGGKLSSLYLPSTLSTVSGNPFRNCTGLSSIEISAQNGHFMCTGGVLYSSDGKTLISYPAARSGEAFTVPPGVTTIAESAFPEKRAYLKQLTFPASVTSVISTLYGFTSLNLPPELKQTVYIVGFSNVTDTFYVPADSAPYVYFADSTIGRLEINDGAVYLNTMGQDTAIGSVTIPSSVTSMASSLFLTEDEKGALTEASYIMYGYKGSRAEEFAKAHKSVTFEYLSDDPVVTPTTYTISFPNDVQVFSSSDDVQLKSGAKLRPNDRIVIYYTGSLYMYMEYVPYDSKSAVKELITKASTYDEAKYGFTGYYYAMTIEGLADKSAIKISLENKKTDPSEEKTYRLAVDELQYLNVYLNFTQIKTSPVEVKENDYIVVEPSGAPKGQKFSGLTVTGATQAKIANSYIYTVNKNTDVRITPKFVADSAAIKYKVTISANLTVTAESDGRYVYSGEFVDSGEKLVVRATVPDGYTFAGISVNGGKNVTTQPYIHTVTSDTYLSAQFSAVTTSTLMTSVTYPVITSAVTTTAKTTTTKETTTKATTTTTPGSTTFDPADIEPDPDETAETTTTVTDDTTLTDEDYDPDDEEEDEPDDGDEDDIADGGDDTTDEEDDTGDDDTEDDDYYDDDTEDDDYYDDDTEDDDDYDDDTEDDDDYDDDTEDDDDYGDDTEDDDDYGDDTEDDEGGSAPSISFVNGLTGLSATSAKVTTKREFFSDTTEISVSNTSEATQKALEAVSALGLGSYSLYAFDITVNDKDNNEKISILPDGYITFRIPVPSGMTAFSDIRVYHLTDSASEKLDSRITTEDGIRYIEFSSSKFSPFMFVGVKDAGIITDSGDAVIIESGNANPHTGMIVMIAVPAAAAAAVLLAKAGKRSRGRRK